ncbi:hypothetical protein M758_10G185700 [Ceratodon purpureus]|uniref:Uncharacterized protein n=1 Tax=Ceratodon purpureus TaxID=3225 RepID=A0A8T0GLY1_CERPU|nr:hypothetical protein KC19_10G190300 [Ceratodon purpureus]KAG0604633.1 hypothetical protein M758_10G185700 [Ceratodon purpureus]
MVDVRVLIIKSPAQSHLWLHRDIAPQMVTFEMIACNKSSPSSDNNHSELPSFYPKLTYCHRYWPAKPHFYSHVALTKTCAIPVSGNPINTRCWSFVSVLGISLTNLSFTSKCEFSRHYSTLF